MGLGRVFLIGFFYGILVTVLIVSYFFLPKDTILPIISLVVLAIILAATDPKKRELDLTKLPDGTRIRLR